MKNLKKVLSLVLALAMTLSLMTVAFGSVKKASSMTSYDKTSYQEAMDVMVGLGVIDGVSGDLQPTANVTREQAAKIIAVLLEGTDAKTMYTTSQYFKDVSATRWSAPYIAYCVEKGIVSGVGAGKFNPTGNVTGYQFAKMLLVALGYDASIESYTGTNWAVNVATDATSAKLFKGVTNANKTVAATREEVAQYALNLLKATMVTYDQTGTSITIGNTSVNVGASKASKVASDDTSINTKISKGDKFTDVNGVTGYSLEFGEKYFSANSSVKLAKSAANDRLMRPAHKWSIKDGDIGTYADSADQSYVLAKNGKSVATILTNSDYMDYDNDDVLDSAVIYINSVKQDTYKNDASITNLLGAGDVIETFTNDDDKVDTIVVTRYTAAKIDDLDTNLSSTYTRKDATVGITLKSVESSTVPGNTLYDAYTGDSTKVLAGFNAKTYTEGTVIAIAMNGNEVLDSHVADAMEGGTISSYNSTSIYVGGTKYSYAAYAAGIDRASLGVAGSVSYDSSNKYNVYTDKDGYVIAVSGAKNSIKNVYYVTGVYSSSSTYGGTSYYAQTVNLTTGEVKEMQLENVDDPNSSTDAFFGLHDTVAFDGTNAGLYTMTDKKIVSGGSTLCKADNSKYNAYPYYGDSDYYVTVANTTSNGTANAYASLESEVKADSTSVRLNASGTYQSTKVVATTTYPNSSTGTNVTGTFSKYIANDTVFTAVEGVKSDIASKTATGSMKMAIGDPKYVAIVYKSNSNKAAYVVYAASDLGGAVSGSDNIIYVDGTQGFTKNTTDSTTNANVYAMSDNSSENIIIDGTDSYDGFYSYSTTSKNYYKLSAKSGTNITTNIGNSTDGYVDDLAVTYYDSDSNIISGTTGYIDGVKYGDAKVIDVRSAADKDDDVYTDSITSVNALNNAMKKSTTNGTTSGVTLDVYVNDGKITFIAVEAIANAAGLTNASAPVITGQPAATGSPYTVGAVANDLSVAVTSPTSGTLSYQWYKGGVAISGATAATYKPATDTVGTTSYYCVVTHTDNNVSGIKTATSESDHVNIIVNPVYYTVEGNVSGTAAAVTFTGATGANSVPANTNASVTIALNTGTYSAADVTVTNAATGTSYGTYNLASNGSTSATITVPVASSNIVLNIAVTSATPA